jgi:thioredoxin-like negative regulator of GroEL
VYLIELTIEQALRRGAAAHKKGKLQDAERLYRVILQSQPAHPDANHNLGVLAVSVNKAHAALPLFKAALDANPKIEQFWLSYIDALIKTEKVDDARRVLADAQQAGVSATKLQIFEGQLECELSPGSQRPQREIIIQFIVITVNCQQQSNCVRLGNIRRLMSGSVTLLNMTLETQKLYHFYPKCSCWIKKRRKQRER